MKLVPRVIPFLAIIGFLAMLPVSVPIQTDVSVPDSSRHVPIAPLAGNTVMTQQFVTAGGPVKSIEFLFGTYKRTNSGSMQIELRANRNGQWVLLAAQQIDKASLHDNAYFPVVFSPPIKVAAGEPLQVVIRSDGTVDQAVTCFANTESQFAGFALSVNDVPQAGNAVFRLSFSNNTHRLVQAIGPLWRRSTVLLTVRWQIVLAIAFGIAIMSIAGLSRFLPDTE